MKAKFDQLYENYEWYWSSHPSKLMSTLLKYKSGGKVLDLGAGEGRNALFLAQSGFHVTAVDASETGIKKLKNLAEKLQLNVRGILADISQFNPPNNYDIVLCLNTLHFLVEEKALNVLEMMKNHTNKKGINIISAFTEDNPSKQFPYLFKRNEIKETYKDWEIIHYRELLTPVQIHGSGKPHRHYEAELIGIK